MTNIRFRGFLFFGGKLKPKKQPKEVKEPKDPNPVNADEKERQQIEPERIDPAKAQETDIFSDDEQKEIVQMVMDDYDLGIQAYADWKAQKERDQQHIDAEPPSKIEGLEKEPWQSDRNLGLMAGTLDIYQATLMATCYNPDSIHFKDSEENDIDNKDNLENFTKWMVSPAEVNLEPEVDDFISNRVSLGFSVFKVDWEVKYEWIDKRIPKYSQASRGNRRRIVSYEIKTEKRRFERGRIRNIDDLDDIVLPSYGDNVQELPFFIEVLHLMLSDIADMEKRKYVASKFFENKKPDEPNNLSSAPAAAASTDSLRNQKAQAQGVTEVADRTGRNFPLDVYEWYGWYEKNGRREKYRFQVEPTTRTFLSGKPLRKIRRDGKIPYVGGPFRRIPGQLRGGSLTKLIAPIINALNNNYNQTSDFQYVENIPFGFANFDEGFTKPIYKVVPGEIFPVEGKPSEAVYFPNIQRSLAWSYQDKQFLLEMIERLTGAASYFLTSKSPDTTATRDNIVEQKGETKFGIWVRRIQNDIVEALNMCVSLYQDWAPPGLGKRVLGENGKQIIKNLSIDSLRGSYDCYMVPDLTSGSKAYEKQIMLWAFKELQQGSVWLSPQINPRGNWLLTKETMIKQGIDNPEHYLPPQPREAGDYSKEAENHFHQLKQGDIPEPPGPDNPEIVQCLATFLRLKETRYQELDEEYRPNFDDYLLKASINYRKFIQNMEKQRMAIQVAASAAMNLERLGMKPTAGGAPVPAGPAAAVRRPQNPAQIPGQPGAGQPAVDATEGVPV